MMTAKMMEALKIAGIAKEWHKNDMHRLYIDLVKADAMYRDNCEHLERGAIDINRREKMDGKLWIDLETGEIKTNGIYLGTVVIGQIVELATYLAPEEKTEEQEERKTEVIDNMKFYVDQLNNKEKAIELLYNAAANCFTLSRESTEKSLYDGIKAQESALIAYCKQERERLAAIIRSEGKMYAKDAALLGFPSYREFYTYNGERYMIVNDEEEPTIKYIEE